MLAFIYSKSMIMMKRIKVEKISIVTISTKHPQVKEVEFIIIKHVRIYKQK